MIFILGLFIGIIIGCVLTLVGVRKSLEYLGEHPETLNQIFGDAFNEVLKRMEKEHTQLNINS